MKFVIIACLLLFLITPTKSDKFKCSLNQDSEDKNCWSISYLCSLEMYFLKTPEAMEPREYLFSNTNVQEEAVCRNLAKALNVSVNEKCKCELEEILRGKDKPKAIEIKNAIANENVPISSK